MDDLARQEFGEKTGILSVLELIQTEQSQVWPLLNPAEHLSHQFSSLPLNTLANTAQTARISAKLVVSALVLGD